MDPGASDGELPALPPLTIPDEAEEDVISVIEDLGQDEAVLPDPLDDLDSGPKVRRSGRGSDASAKPPLADQSNGFPAPRYLGYTAGVSAELQEQIEVLLEHGPPGKELKKRQGTGQSVSPGASFGVKRSPTADLSVKRSPTADHSVTRAGTADLSVPATAMASSPNDVSAAARAEQQQILSGAPDSSSPTDIASPVSAPESFPTSGDLISPTSPTTGPSSGSVGNDLVDILLGPPRFGLKVIYWFLGVKPDAPLEEAAADRAVPLAPPSSPVNTSLSTLPHVNLSDVHPEWYIKSLSILSYRRLLRLWSGYPPSFTERLTWFILAFVLAAGLLTISIIRLTTYRDAWPFLIAAILVFIYSPRYVMSLPLGARFAWICLLAAGQTVIAVEYAVNKTEAPFIELLRTNLTIQIVFGVVGGACALAMLAFVGWFIYWFAFFPLLLFAAFDPESVLGKTFGRWPVADWKVRRFDVSQLQGAEDKDAVPGGSFNTLRRRRTALGGTLRRSNSVVAAFFGALNTHQATSGWYRFRVIEPGTALKLRYRKNNFRYIWDERAPGREAARGRPHGWGTWESSDMGGESIEGFWVDGEPTAPYLAVESRTGCASRAIRVGVARCHVADFDTGYVVPGPDPFRDGLRWILTSVECSVSGTFFSHLPRAVVMRRDGDPASGAVVQVPYPATCEEVLQRLSVTISPPGDDDRLIFADSERKRDSAVLAQESSPVPRPPAQQQPTECIIFVHGYNTSPKYAVQMLGQVLTLGEFPPTIRPFVFAWPGGSSIISFFNARRNSQKDEVRDALVEMITKLTSHGFESFHLIGHSLGSRVLTRLAEPDNPDAYLDSPCPLSRLFRPVVRSQHAFREPAAAGTFAGGRAANWTSGRRPRSRTPQPTASQPQSATARTEGMLPELATFTLIAAEIDLQSWQSNFINVYKFCRVVTIYADEYDVALRIAKSFDSKARLGASAGKVGTGLIDAFKRAGTAIGEVPGQVIRAGTNMTNMVIGAGRASQDALGRRSMDPGGTAGRPANPPGSVAIPMEEVANKDDKAVAAEILADLTPRQSLSGTATPTEEAANGQLANGAASSQPYLSNFSLTTTLASVEAQADRSAGANGRSMTTASLSVPGASPAGGSDTETVPEGDHEVVVLPPPPMAMGTMRFEGDRGDRPTPSGAALAATYPQLPGVQHFDSLEAYFRHILSHGMDVIDGSNLDQNVHLLRHSTFTLNRSMVDDIFDVVVSRRRAKERPYRLVRLDRNRWQFRVAPLWRSAAS
ncbi:hypothetical protein DFJ74DRAFT_650121 [Hyaloraphidium curvatum]|nr:hypothetical protein DFJ74DRAFT_650121 [Hyaloraphidium curvatum]